MDKAIKLGSYSNSENGIVHSALGISPCVCGGGQGHEATTPKIFTMTEKEFKDGFPEGVDLNGKHYTSLEEINKDGLYVIKEDGDTITFGGIRKLTPHECFRLMGVPEEKIPIITSSVSKTNAYKLAGNSIVCDVLFHLFRKMFVEKGQDITKGQPIQLSLFG